MKIDGLKPNQIISLVLYLNTQPIEINLEYIVHLKDFARANKN